MDYRQAKSELKSLSDFIDGNIDKVAEISATLQERIYKLLLSRLQQFDTVDGRLVATQDYRRRILDIERRMEEILGQKNYKESIGSFLNSFEEIQDRNVLLQRTFNEIDVAKSTLTPARLLLYEQAKDALLPALNNTYVQPAKMLLMQQITTGATLSESETLLRNWNQGELNSGRLANGVKAPALDKYTTQIARDSSYGVHRNINNIIKDKYELERLIYVGDIIKDSRPFCRHLVGLNRPIELNEIPPLVKLYPEGLYPNTSKRNFMQVAGGYGCRHLAMAVR